MIRKPKAFVLMAVIAGALVLGAVTVPLTNHPKFCASCHTITPSYDSWAKSTHKDVTCVACHVGPGVEGFIHDKVYTGTKDVLITLLGSPTEPHNLQSTVHTQACVNCHQAILRVSEVSPRDLPSPVKEVGLIMNHKVHMKAFAQRGKGEGCTTCHSRVVHGTPIKNYPMVIPRGHVKTDSEPWYPEHPEGSKLRKAALADCFQCHDGKSTHEGKVISQKCQTCHIPEKIQEFLLF